MPQTINEAAQKLAVFIYRVLKCGSVYVDRRLEPFEQNLGDQASVTFRWAAKYGMRPISTPASSNRGFARTGIWFRYDTP
jgi:hypothetical protein